jgi:hypothetical protein
VRRAVEAKAHERGAGLTGREAQRVRPVDSELVQPEQDRPVRKEARPEERRPHRQPRTRGWVAEGVELVAASHQRQRQRASEGDSCVEPVEQVEDRGAPEEDE